MNNTCTSHDEELLEQLRCSENIKSDFRARSRRRKKRTIHRVKDADNGIAPEKDEEWQQNQKHHENKINRRWNTGEDATFKFRKKSETKTVEMSKSKLSNMPSNSFVLHNPTQCDNQNSCSKTNHVSSATLPLSPPSLPRLLYQRSIGLSSSTSINNALILHSLHIGNKSVIKRKKKIHYHHYYDSSIDKDNISLCHDHIFRNGWLSPQKSLTTMQLIPPICQDMTFWQRLCFLSSPFQTVQKGLNIYSDNSKESSVADSSFATSILDLNVMLVSDTKTKLSTSSEIEQSLLRQRHLLSQTHKRWKPGMFRSIPFSLLQTPDHDAVLGLDRTGSYLIALGPYNYHHCYRSRSISKTDYHDTAALSLRFYGLESQTSLSKKHNASSPMKPAPLFFTVPLLVAMKYKNNNMDCSSNNTHGGTFIDASADRTNNNSTHHDNSSDDDESHPFSSNNGVRSEMVLENHFGAASNPMQLLMSSDSSIGVVFLSNASNIPAEASSSEIEMIPSQGDDDNSCENDLNDNQGTIVIFSLSPLFQFKSASLPCNHEPFASKLRRNAQSSNSFKFC